MRYCWGWSWAKAPIARVSVMTPASSQRIWKCGLQTMRRRDSLDPPCFKAKQHCLLLLRIEDGKLGRQVWEEIMRSKSIRETDPTPTLSFTAYHMERMPHVAVPLGSFNQSEPRASASGQEYKDVRSLTLRLRSGQAVAARIRFIPTVKPLDCEDPL